MRLIAIKVFSCTIRENFSLGNSSDTNINISASLIKFALGSPKIILMFSVEVFFQCLMILVLKRV